MKASKFTDAQKAFIIKQGEEGTPVAEICRKAEFHCPAGSCAA
jgi:putative transposase